MSMPHEARQEVERFLFKGEKTGAIKHLQDKYAFSLEEARVIVEAVETQVTGSRPDSAADHKTRELGKLEKSHIIDLLIDGQKPEAIKYAKDHLDVPLKHAEDTVESIERELFPRRGSSKSSASGTLAAKIALSVFMIVGLIFSGVATYIFLKQSESIESSDLITGKVIRLEYNHDGMSAPVIEYEWDGQKWLYASTTWSSPPAYEVDEEVPIYVNREDPEDIIVDTFSDRWLLITVFGVLGASFVAISGLVALFTLRR